MAAAPSDEAETRLAARFVADVREEYFSVLGHLLDSRYYRTHDDPGRPAPTGKFSAKRRGYVVSMGQDLGALKISGWTHTIPEYFDLDRFWERYPGAAPSGSLQAHVWGMHHRYPTNSPALDAEGRGNPAGAHPFKAYNVLLMHNGEQVGVDSTSPFLREFGYVHVDESMGEGAALYEGDSLYDRKALTDTEYAAYLIDFTRRVLGLSTEEASQIVSPITGLDLAAVDDERRRRFALLGLNYVQLTPTGPYKFTIVESRPGEDENAQNDQEVENIQDEPSPDWPRSRRLRSDLPRPRRVGFRENMDIKFLRPHELVVSVDTGPGGVQAVANGSEAKIADAMLRELHRQGVLADAGHDLRFSMRPGGNPGRGEFGGVVEAFLHGPARSASTWPTASASRSWRRAPGARQRCGRRCAPLRSMPAGERSSTTRWPRSGAHDAPRHDRSPSLGRAGPGKRAFSGPRRPAARAGRGPGLRDAGSSRRPESRRLSLPGRAGAAGLRGGRPRRRPRLRPARAGRAAQAGRLLRPGRQGALVDRVPDRRRPRRRGARRGRHRPPARRGALAARGARRRGGPGGRRLAARAAGGGGGLWARLTAATRDDLLPPSDPAGTFW